MTDSKKAAVFISLTAFLLAVGLFPAGAESTATSFAYGGAADVSIPIVVPDVSPGVHQITFTFALNFTPEPANPLSFKLTVPPTAPEATATDTYDLDKTDGSWGWASYGESRIEVTVTGNGDHSYSVVMHRYPTTPSDENPRGAIEAGVWYLRVIMTLPDPAADKPLIYTTQSGSLGSIDVGGNPVPPGAVSFVSPSDPEVPDPFPDSIIHLPATGADPAIAVPGIDTALCLDYFAPVPAPPATTVAYEWEGGVEPVGDFSENTAPATCRKEYLLKPDANTYPVTAAGEPFTLKHTVTYRYSHPLELQRSQPLLVDHLPQVPAPPTNLRIEIGSSDKRSLQIKAIPGYEGDPLELTIDNDADLSFTPTDDGYFRATLEPTASVEDGDFEAPDESYGGITPDTGTYLHFRYVPVTDTIFTKTLNISYQVDGTTVQAPITLQGEGMLGSPRNPQDIAVVLDRSGSMSGSTSCDTDGSILTKIEALRQAAALFYRILGIVAGSTGDTLSVVEYNQSPYPMVASGPASANSATAAGLLEAMDPGGSTSISLAVNQGLNSITLSPIPDDHDRAVVLMTDGRHNTPGGQTFEAHFDSLPIDPASPQPGQCHMYVVGLGNEGNLNASLLTGLSRGTLAELTQNFLAGGYRHTCEDRKLAIYFAQILAENFRDLDVVSDDPGTLTPGEPSVQHLPVNSSARRAVFYLTWQDPQIELDFRLKAPDGTEIPAEHAAGGDLFKLQVIDIPYRHGERVVKHGGDWQMIVSLGAGGAGASAAPAPVDFEAAVMVSDRVIRSDFSIVQGDHFAGERVILTARFTEGGQPLQNAEIVVVAAVPAVGLGDFIYQNELSGDIDVPAGDEGDTPETLKLAALLDQMPEGLQTVILEIPMRDDGVLPDESAADGIYTLGLLTDAGASQTENNGVYTYTFRAQGSTELGEPVKRTTVLSHYLPSLVSDEASDVTANVVDPRTAVVSVTLRDRFGHFIDPAAGRRLTIGPAEPKIVEFRVKEEENRLDGTRSFVLQASSGTFSRFADFNSIVDVDIAGLGAPPADLTVRPFFRRLGLGFLGGYSFFPPGASVSPALFAGAELLLQPLYLFEFTGEAAVHRTTDGGGADGLVVQYGLSGAMTVPFDLPRMKLQIAAGAGGVTFTGFAVEETNFSLHYGIRFIIRFDRDRRFEAAAGFRDLVLTKSHGSSFIHVPQATGGFRIRS